MSVHFDRVSTDVASSRPSVAEAHIPALPAVPRTAVLEPVEGFLTSRRFMGCAPDTMRTYAYNLRRFVKAVGSEPNQWTRAAVQDYLAGLQARMKQISVHQHYRTLRTFFRWALAEGILSEDPLRGVTMIAPETFPRVPADADVTRLIAACSDTWEGVRNRALVALLADSGVRISEALRLRVEDLNFREQTLWVRLGKGQRDRVGVFSVQAARHLKAWLDLRQKSSTPGLFLFCIRNGDPLTRSNATHILHRLSVKTGLSKKVGPHALRHYVGTTLSRDTGDLQLVQRVLGHSTLTMALRYARMTGADMAAKFQRASPLDRLYALRKGQ